MTMNVSLSKSMGSLLCEHERNPFVGCLQHPKNVWFFGKDGDSLKSFFFSLKKKLLFREKKIK